MQVEQYLRDYLPDLTEDKEQESASHVTCYLNSRLFRADLRDYKYITRVVFKTTERELTIIDRTTRSSMIRLNIEDLKEMARALDLIIKDLEYGSSK